MIGDSGTDEREQYEVAKETEIYRQKAGFDFVIMLGDNVYGSHLSKVFAEKFEQPYKLLLDAGVKFYANHDDPARSGSINLSTWEQSATTHSKKVM